MGNFRGPKTKKFCIVKKAIHLKFEPFISKDHGFTSIQRLLLLDFGDTLCRASKLWTTLNQPILKLEGSNFACWFIFKFKNIFVFGPWKLSANWRNPRPHLAAADANLRRHEIKKFPIMKKNMTEKKQYFIFTIACFRAILY